ncbi:hypothetical protein BV898_13781 [Hypsibius exemplaris]|uniref:Uncharacterized protein n=1 Tax=Hypsibius exemplaris TaxID=2072580 RepID=A0A1W0W9S2_HYPEX|nr:hypothetical protein BV898_13781 [Hypsibius exemplaris]
MVKQTRHGWLMPFLAFSSRKRWANGFFWTIFPPGVNEVVAPDIPNQGFHPRGVDSYVVPSPIVSFPALDLDAITMCDYVNETPDVGWWTTVRVPNYQMCDARREFSTRKLGGIV